MLLKFDADNVISASSEFECCQYEWGFDKIVNQKTEIEEKDSRMTSYLQHKNGLVAMFALGKLRKMFDDL